MPEPPPYSYSQNFSKSRAIELAALIDAAYQQLTDFQNNNAWNVPGPRTVTPQKNQVNPVDPTVVPGPKQYQIEAQFSAVETWGLPSVVPKPRIPFGFVATAGNDVYVAIRGTQTPLEWLDDATVGFEPFVPNTAAKHCSTRPGLGEYHQRFLRALHPDNYGHHRRTQKYTSRRQPSEFPFRDRTQPRGSTRPPGCRRDKGVSQRRSRFVYFFRAPHRRPGICPSLY